MSTHKNYHQNPLIHPVEYQDPEDFGTIEKPDLMKEHRRMVGKALMVGVVVFALGYLWESARHWK